MTNKTPFTLIPTHLPPEGERERGHTQLHILSATNSSGANRSISRRRVPWSDGPARFGQSLTRQSNFERQTAHGAHTLHTLVERFSFTMIIVRGKLIFSYCVLPVSTTLLSNVQFPWWPQGQLSDGASQSVDNY